MNERIKELTAQAGMTKMQQRSDGLYVVSESVLEEFAELIVKECVQSIEKTIETICDTDSEKMGCEFAITDMLEHFGVGE